MKANISNHSSTSKVKITVVLDEEQYIYENMVSFVLMLRYPDGSGTSQAVMSSDEMLGYLGALARIGVDLHKENKSNEPPTE